jgi:hypothetical protein
MNKILAPIGFGTAAMGSSPDRHLLTILVIVFPIIFPVACLLMGGVMQH